MKKIAFNPVDWTYQNKKEWLCPSHQFQSPINIINDLTTPMKENGEIILRYRKKIDAIVNTGYCIQGYLKGVASINQRNFEFQQFHFHAKGEHTIDGKEFPLELHLVHQAENGQLAVIAILFEIGEKNATMDVILDHLNQAEFENNANLLSLIPKSLNYYHYLGSLTTPPLTENVEWYVLIEPMTLSKQQLHRLTNIHNDNYREVQEINGRQVLKKVFYG